MARLTFGTEVQDRITGFKGTVVAYAEYMYGTPQYGLRANRKTGDASHIFWFSQDSVVPVRNLKEGEFEGFSTKSKKKRQKANAKKHKHKK